MDKKLYYKDPLAAAYMMREFDVKIHTGGGDMCVITVDFCLNRYEQDFTSLGGKLYIHPSSYHIFEPQQKDFVWMGGHTGFADYYKKGRFPPVTIIF